MRAGRLIRRWWWRRAIAKLGQFLERLMSDAGWDVIVAGTAAEARRLTAKRKPHAVFCGSRITGRPRRCAGDAVVPRVSGIAGDRDDRRTLPMEENAMRWRAA